MRQDNNSLAHTTWNCKYHIVFAPKYRRQIIYGKYKASIGQIFRLLCERKGIEIHEARSLPRSYLHVGEYTTEAKYLLIYGIFKG